jgi:hypothetical protein
VLRAASFYAALPSTTAVAITAALEVGVSDADPDAEGGARSAVPSCSAVGSAGPIRSLGVRLPSGRRWSAHRSFLPVGDMLSGITYGSPRTFTVASIARRSLRYLVPAAVFSVVDPRSVMRA